MAHHEIRDFESCFPEAVDMGSDHPHGHALLRRMKGQGGAKPSARAPDRHSQGDHAIDEFFIVQGEAISPDLRQMVLKRRGIGDRVPGPLRGQRVSTRSQYSIASTSGNDRLQVSPISSERRVSTACRAARRSTEDRSAVARRCARGPGVRRRPSISRVRDCSCSSARQSR